MYYSHARSGRILGTGLPFIVLQWLALSGPCLVLAGRRMGGGVGRGPDGWLGLVLGGVFALQCVSLGGCISVIFVYTGIPIGTCWSIGYYWSPAGGLLLDTWWRTLARDLFFIVPETLLLAPGSAPEKFETPTFHLFQILISFNLVIFPATLLMTVSSHMLHELKAFLSDTFASLNYKECYVWIYLELWASRSFTKCFSKVSGR